MSRPEPALQRVAKSSRRRNQLGQAMGAKGLQTRQRLLLATETLLNSTPLRELRVGQIVRVAGTSTATFYVYFNDVSEAVLALIGELSQSPPSMLALVRQPWQGETGIDRAHEFVASYVEQYQRHAAAFRVRNLAADEGDVRFTDLRINAVAPLLAAMAERISNRQASGDLPADLHPVSTAGALLAMIERIAVVQFSGSQGVTRPRLLHVAAFFAALLLGSAFSDRRSEPQPFVAMPAEDRGSARQGTTTTSPPTGASVGQLNLHGQAIGAKGARTRQRLIEATNDLLRTESLLDLSVAKIARAAKTSPSTFYLYFQDVTEAVLAAIGQVEQSTPELLALWEGDWDESTIDQRAYGFVTRYIERWHENRALFRVRNLAAEEGDERFLQVRSRSVRPLMDLIGRRVAACQAEGRLPADLHPDSAAAACLAMIERLAATPNIVSDVTIASVSRAAGYFLSFLMGGSPRGSFHAPSSVPAR